MAEPASLGQLEKQSRDFDAECVKLEGLVAALECDLDLVKRNHLTALKRQAAVVANREAELRAAIESAPQLFVKPRTFTLNGIKLGLQASAGSITWDDDEQVVGRIKEEFPKRLAELVKTEHTPKKTALKALTPEELARIGCRIEGAGDVVILSRVAGDVEKLVTKLIEKMVAAMTEKPAK